jgi:hypothetical protein
MQKSYAVLRHLSKKFLPHSPREALLHPFLLSFTPFRKLTRQNVVSGSSAHLLAI